MGKTSKPRPFIRLQTRDVAGAPITVALVRNLKYAPYVVLNRSLRDRVLAETARARLFQPFVAEFESAGAAGGFLRIKTAELVQEVARFSGETRLRYLGGLASPALAARTCSAMGASELAAGLLSLVPPVPDAVPAISLAASSGAGHRLPHQGGATLKDGAASGSQGSRGSGGSSLRNGVERLISRAAALNQQQQQQQQPGEEEAASLGGSPQPAEEEAEGLHEGQEEENASAGSAQGGVAPEGAALTVVKRTLSVAEKNKSYRLKPADIQHYLNHGLTDFSNWSENGIQLNRT